MSLSYKAKHRWSKFWKIALLTVLALILACILRFIYLERFLVYDENGVHLDYGGKTVYAPDEPQSSTKDDFVLKQEEGNIHAGPVASLYRGFSLRAGQILNANSRRALSENLADCNAVMLEMKTNTGKFLYATSLSQGQTANFDLNAMSAWLEELRAVPGLKLIAKLPAFQDSAFALADYSHALAIRNGALWMDENGSYWLDPANSEVVDYLVNAARELHNLGFDEVVFENFHFPDSSNIVYAGKSGKEAALAAAKEVKERLDLWGIEVSFLSTDEEIVALGQRVYLTVESGAQVEDEAARYADLIGTETGRLVFCIDSRDTRFDDYSKLAPFEIAK